MSLIKVVCLIQYSEKKTNFRKIKLVLDIENWHRKLKNAIFDSLQFKVFIRYQKILWRYFFGGKNLLNVTCLTMKFITVITLLGGTWERSFMTFLQSLIALRKSKSDTNIIWTSLRETKSSKGIRLWIKKWACHAHFKFEIKVVCQFWI